ncbi:MAG TPA: PAS domain S-box protein [Burkholderiales bacterium]|nr:PAS domain S-box protein [Burkholderiales bacterium]
MADSRTDDLPVLLPGARFPALLYLSPQPISLSELQTGRYIEVNQAWLDFFGYTREEALGKSREELSIWISQDEGVRMRSRLERGEVLRNTAAQCRKKSGEVADVQFTCDLVDFEGRRCLFAAFNDVTELTRAQKALRVSEERFGKIFDSLPQCVTIASLRSGVFLEVNPACERVYGYSRAEIVGRTVDEIGLWADLHDREQITASLAPGEARAIETRFRHKSGRVIEALCTMTRSELDGEEVLLAVSVDITDRKRAERLLKSSEERFSRMIEASPQSITITRLSDGTYLDMNRAGLTRLGYRREEVIGRSSTELNIWVDPRTRERLRAQFAAGQSIASIETQARRKDGGIIDLIFSATVLELDGERVIHGTAVDVSEFKRLARQKQQSEERFSKVFRASIDPIAISTLADGRYLEVNDAWCRLFGFTPAQAVGHTAQELNMWADEGGRQPILRILQDTGSLRNAEMRMRRSSGEVLEIMMSADTLELDGVACVISVVVDFTEKRRAEHLRTLSEERFAMVFRASPSAIAISRRRSGIRVDVNDAWLKMFGYSREEAIGRTIEELEMWADDAERARLQKMIREQGSLRQTPARMRRKSGEIIEILISLEPIEFDGEPHIVACLEDITERVRAERHIEYLATRDHLTGLPNRLLFSDRLRQAMAKAEREQARIALLFIDLDRFKDINDSLGHHIGDRLLVEVAERLRGAIRAADTLARQGGDEFLVLIDGLDEAGAAESVARKLVDVVGLPVRIEGRALTVSCSLGISIFPDDARTAAELMRNADLAMYSVKGGGRHGYRFYSADMNTRLTERLELENELRAALEREEFELHYQPKINLASGAVTGCEALLRWRHPRRGLILPAQFIGVAEESQLIVPIGAWVLRRACAQMRLWLDAGLAPVPVAVNLSVQQFDAGLPDAVASVLAHEYLPPALLEIEITETGMMSNSAAHMEIARRLKELGVRIALDDFGTGYSSLSYLRQMDIDVLKIDQSFVRELPGSVEDGTIIAAITAMAAQFGIKVVAEGVETQAQADALKGMNCGECQGYLFGRPVPEEEFGRLYLRAR